MKKILLLFILLLCLVPFVTGCTEKIPDENKESTENITGEENKDSEKDPNENNNNSNTEITIKNGTEIAKILLAQERLDTSVFETEGNLFTDGKKAMARLVNETRKYAKRYAGRPNESYTEVDGDTYKWYNDVDYSNSMSFFESYVYNIEFNAERGAQLIDYTKKYIRVLNTWIKQDYFEYFLIVDKDSEVIIRRNSDWIDICKRYSNESGVSVYETLYISSITEIRMKYIPGQLYEFTSIDKVEEGTSIYLYADNYKGYWQIISTTGIFTQNIAENEKIEYTGLQYLVMKEEATYNISYDISTTYGSRIGQINLISSDGKTDLVSLNQNTIRLYNTGIKGLDYMAIDAPKDKVGKFDPNSDVKLWVYEKESYDDNDEPYKSYSTSGRESAYAVCENGLVINCNDELVGGRVRAGHMNVHSVAGCDSYGIIPFYTTASSLNEQYEILELLLEETGLSFRRDYDTVVGCIDYALKDAENFPLYYTYNGYHINTLDSLKKSFDIEKIKLEEFVDFYNEIKDLEVIDYYDQEKYDEKLHLSEIEVIESPIVTNNELEVTVSNIKLKVEDTILFVDKEKYKIMFGLLSLDNNIIAYESESYLEFEYKKGEEFILEQSATFKINLLTTGEYVLVAYVALSTLDVRITKYVKLEAEVTEYEYSYLGYKNSIKANEDNQFTVYSEIDYNIISIISGDYTYSELAYYMLELSYIHGMIDGYDIEYFDGENWILLDAPKNDTEEAEEQEPTEEVQQDTTQDVNSQDQSMYQSFNEGSRETVEYLPKGQYRLKYIANKPEGDENDYYVYVTIE